jgi:hypothetical protein
LLEGVFQLDAPGVFPIRAWHKVDIRADAANLQIVASQEVTTEFELGFIEGSEEELASAYVPILRDLKSPDPMTSSMARSPVVQNPPLLLEDLILAMADDPHTVDAAISGLQRLATPRAKPSSLSCQAHGVPRSCVKWQSPRWAGWGILHIAR